MIRGHTYDKQIVSNTMFRWWSSCASFVPLY